MTDKVRIKEMGKASSTLAKADSLGKETVHEHPSQPAALNLPGPLPPSSSVHALRPPSADLHPPFPSIRQPHTLALTLPLPPPSASPPCALHPPPPPSHPSPMRIDVQPIAELTMPAMALTTHSNSTRGHLASGHG